MSLPAAPGPDATAAPAPRRLRAAPDPPPGARRVRRSRIRSEPWLRRVAELGIVVPLVLALLPVLVTVALLVRLTSRGPVLYRQTRVGVGGRPITMRKFRSMRVDADTQVHELRHRNEASGPLFKIRDDPRVTPLGRWLRRTSLDELPQLFNVLGGSMSLVGPRPALPAEAARFSAQERLRHSVRPGLTGLAQVRGRSDLDWDEAVRLDLHYVEHRSPGMDLWILWHTVPAVASGRGAY